MRFRLDARVGISLSLFLFLLIIDLSYSASFVMPILRLLAIIYAALLIPYLVIYVLYRDSAKATKNRATKIIFWIFPILLSFIAFYYAGSLASSPLLFIKSTLAISSSIGAYLVLLLPLLFIATFASYFLSKKNSKAFIILSALILSALLFYMLSGLIFTHYTLDDETVISFLSVKAFLSSTNPYGLSFGSFLLHNSSTIPSTITTSNKVMGNLEYPSLYFLISSPFYLVSGRTLYNLSHLDMPLEAAVFLFILIISLSLLTNNEDDLSPRYQLILFFIISVTFLASIPVYLMLAVLLWSYAKLDKRYAFVLLGIALSLQEELWIPVIFLLIYSLNNYGLRKGIRDVIGSVCVFLLINSYFILSSPYAYINSVFAPLGALIMPGGSALIGFLLISSYHLSLLALPKLFYLVLLTLAILLVYLNKKELIPLFSMIPFLFLSHSLVSYFSLFTFFFVFALFIQKPNAEEGYIQKHFGGARTTLITIMLLLLMSCTAAVIVMSAHQEYMTNFDLSVLNQSVISSGNYTYYNATLTYNRLENNTIFVAVTGVSNGTIGSYGFFNNSLINQSHYCLTIECEINTNKVQFNGSSGAYVLHLKVPAGQLSTGPYALMVYNNEYYYLSKPILPKRSNGSQ